ncbi:alpha/beta fold hydrolase [Acuticoccus mangrovi]|uniref:Alpha/beta hydrolase n=1 Tax=Acuticoccus mangrovi TaxID=2796142 RepID=A0A934IQE3_9HYPH|nr:alpha/beta hydrolase [Acuticoccus mangrovi]MBJ3778172.1 alpha/beta hydrolase [Acuticoccus mangrovi]
MAEPMRISVDTPRLSIAAEVSGPQDGAPLFLLHGWPDDVRTWDGILADCHAAGFRTIVPWLRGFGPTVFRDVATQRAGDLESLGQDVLDLMDGMGIAAATLVGHDWGARAAYVASHAAPERVKACVGISVGWGTNTPDQPLSYEMHHNYWYHWLFATPRGARILADDRRGLTRFIWSLWAPDWPFSDATFEATAAAFDNPDWVAIVLHSYRVRWGHAAPDPAYDDLRAAQTADPVIRVPTLTLHGGADPCNLPETSLNKEHLFCAGYERRVMEGLGHFPQREAPADTAREVLAFIR